MTREDLTTVDLQNIAIALATCEVKGVQQAAALVVLHNKVLAIIQGEANGNGHSTESDKPSASQSTPAAN